MYLQGGNSLHYHQLINKTAPRLEEPPQYFCIDLLALKKVAPLPQFGYFQSSFLLHH